MKRLTSLIILLLSFLYLPAQDISIYFEKIRNDKSALTSFFSKMPKGGDLHHHYSGSLYAETYWDLVYNNNYWVNTNTLQVLEKPPKDLNGFKRFKEIDPASVGDLRYRIIKEWSVKDYYQGDEASDKHFFETFGLFAVASKQDIASGLSELKQRAKNEHVSYIETIFNYLDCGAEVPESDRINSAFRSFQTRQNEAATIKTLDSLYTFLKKTNAFICVEEFNKAIEERHSSLGIDDHDFTMRYQNYVLRFFDPVTVFRSMLASFESAAKSPLIVGVNIVAPEDGPVSMQDYWLHMMMYQYCHKKFPEIKYSMHAGELTLGLVKPEQLSWHVNSAVHIAGAQRIGHGVDMAYEKNNYELLHYMAENKIAIEINLVSNEFILNVKEDEHPIMLYKKYNVPVVLSTDDAGVLRTNHTEQFVLAAMRYPELKYADLKQFVYNSIRYSFIEEEKIKVILTQKLEKDFKEFEAYILKHGR